MPLVDALPVAPEVPALEAPALEVAVAVVVEVELELELELAVVVVVVVEVEVEVALLEVPELAPTDVALLVVPPPPELQPAATKSIPVASAHFT